VSYFTERFGWKKSRKVWENHGLIVETVKMEEKRQSHFWLCLCVVHGVEFG
jgi:hypothetical protein